MEKKIDKSRSLYARKRKLAGEWHPTKNGDLTPKDVMPMSNKKVWWKCRKNHEWEAQVCNRSSGRNCPYCGNKKVCKDNCLAAVNLKLAKEWHPAKNGKLTPEDVTPFSRKRVWWECEKGHAWHAEIYSRHKGRGCHYCKGRKVCSDNSLAAVNPKLAKEWHPTKNGKLTPDDVTIGSDKKVWWKCKKGHEWEKMISGRRKGIVGCPYCSNYKVCKDNCLAIVHPKVAKEWHPSKNGDLTPDNVTHGSGKRVWWQCTYGHEWTAPVYKRSAGDGNCPVCRKELRKLGFYYREITPGVRIRSR